MNKDVARRVRTAKRQKRLGKRPSIKMQRLVVEAYQGLVNDLTTERDVLRARLDARESHGLFKRLSEACRG